MSREGPKDSCPAAIFHRSFSCGDTAKKDEKATTEYRQDNDAVGIDEAPPAVPEGVREVVVLRPIRYARMRESPFGFFRGAAALMAADLVSAPVTEIRVQACGDCHVANFGGFRTPERQLAFDINDFDETLPAPWEWMSSAWQRALSLRCARQVLVNATARTRRAHRLNPTGNTCANTQK